MYRILHQSILRVTTNESAKAIVKVLVAAYTCWATFNYATRGWGFLIFKFFKHEQAQVLMSLSTDTFQLIILSIDTANGTLRDKHFFLLASFFAIL